MWSGYQWGRRARSPSVGTPRGTVSEREDEWSRGGSADSSRRWTGGWTGGVEGLVLSSDVWEAERRVGWIRRVGWVGGLKTAPRCSAAAQRSGRPTDGRTHRRGSAAITSVTSAPPPQKRHKTVMTPANNNQLNPPFLPPRGYSFLLKFPEETESEGLISLCGFMDIFPSADPPPLQPLPSVCCFVPLGDFQCALCAK